MSLCPYVFQKKSSIEPRRHIGILKTIVYYLVILPMSLCPYVFQKKSSIEPHRNIDF